MYAKLDGDSDGWVQTADTGRASVPAFSGCCLIDEPLLKRTVVATAQASEAFAADGERQRRDCTTGDATRDTLRAPAAKGQKPDGC